jgi:hypothetical protein
MLDLGEVMYSVYTASLITGPGDLMLILCLLIEGSPFMGLLPVLDPDVFVRYRLAFDINPSIS